MIVILLKTALINMGQLNLPVTEKNLQYGWEGTVYLKPIPSMLRNVYLKKNF